MSWASIRARRWWRSLRRDSLTDWPCRRDALALPFADGAFERVFTGHFYGHLPESERAAFLTEAGRVASELIVIDTARRPDVPAERWDDRRLNDGSTHRVYKRYLTGAQLAAEIGGTVLMDGSWFVAALRPRR